MSDANESRALGCFGFAGAGALCAIGCGIAHDLGAKGTATAFLVVGGLFAFVACALASAVAKDGKS